MKSSWFALGVTALLLLAPLAASAQDVDAPKLAQAVFDRPAGRDLTTVSRMELSEKGRAPRVRALVTYRIQRAKGESSNLIRFLEPKDVEGTGLLSIDKADGANEQWLYLPALDRVRRVSGDRKGGRFVGSDLYLEDLQSRNPAKDKQRLVAKETINGVACVVLESIPLDLTDSVYRKRLSWIDPVTLMPERVDYFEKDDSSPSKRWVALGKKKSKGFWTVTDSRMTDLESGHETRLIVEVVAYDRNLPAKLFTSQTLADERFESEYRP